jgi:hypothetical protein
MITKTPAPATRTRRTHRHQGRAQAGHLGARMLIEAILAHLGSIGGPDREAVAVLSPRGLPRQPSLLLLLRGQRMDHPESGRGSLPIEMTVGKGQAALHTVPSTQRKRTSQLRAYSVTGRRRPSRWKSTGRFVRRRGTNRGIRTTRRPYRSFRH